MTPDDVPAGTPNHWGTHDPASEPDRSQVAGIGRMVTEARDRMGPAATPEAVLAELTGRGMELTAGDVQKAWGGAG